MTLQGMGSGYAFSGNPVIFSDTTLPDNNVSKGTFKVFLGHRKIYDGRFSLPVGSINIAEIIDGELSPVPLPKPINDSWLTPACNIAAWDSHSMQLKAEYDSGAEYLSPIVRIIRGRIPSALYKTLTTAGKDIFSERFLNPEANFLLTSRTGSRYVEIPETELYPLCLLLPGGKSVKVSTDAGDFESVTVRAGIYWLDLDRIRRDIFLLSEGATLVNIFRIGIGDGEPAIQVVVTRAEHLLNRVRIRYRNYYDIPEILALEGTLTLKPDADQGLKEGKDNLRYLPVCDDFILEGEDTRWRPELTLTTGPVSPRDLPRLIEAMTSREVALESPVDGTWLPVVPSAGDISFPLRPETPQSYEITLKSAHEDLSLLSMLAPEEKDPWRIFTQEFDDKFN